MIPGGRPVAALTVLVLTVALDIPELFTQGPGIQPGGAGPLPLIGVTCCRVPCQ